MLRKNVAGQFIYFCAINASTGATMTGTTGFAAFRVIDGGAQASATGTVTDKGNGQYSFALSQADTNGNDIGLLFTMTGMVAVSMTIVTTACDPTAATNFGITALPTTAVTTNASLLTSGTGTAQLSVTSGLVTLAGVTHTGAVIPTVTTVTNQLTAAAIATGVWQDATAGDFTVASSIGKSLYTGNVAPGAAGGHFIAGTNAATTVTTAFTTTFTGNLTGSVGSVTGAVGSISGVTFPTNFGVLAIAATTGQVGIDWANIKSPTTVVALTGTTIATTQKVDLETIKTQAVTAAAGVTFPTSLASPTNITAGTITTTTNLTNAPTAGDFTAVMKTSLNAATPASVVGAVGSVTARVTANADQVAGSATAATNLGAQLLAQASGNVNDASATTTSFAGNAGLSATNDAYTNQVIAFTSGTLTGVARKVVDYVGATKTFTLTPALPSAPANGTTFVILGYAP